MRYATMADRIIANSVLSPDHAWNGTPCWEWMRRLNNHGYPTMTRRLKRGPRKGQVVTVFVHREAIAAFTGRHMTPRMVAMHQCNNRSCVNPEHLKGGTQRQNVRQCVCVCGRGGTGHRFGLSDYPRLPPIKLQITAITTRNSISVLMPSHTVRLL